jgi:hypothetical protein
VGILLRLGGEKMWGGIGQIGQVGRVGQVGLMGGGDRQREYRRQNAEDGGGQKNTRAEEQGTTEDRRGRMDDGGSRKGRGKNFLQSAAEVVNRGICQEAAHILAQRSLFEC